MLTEPSATDPGRYGDYEIESFLAKGSIGKVYLARHRRIGRRVALKTVHVEHQFDDDDDRIEFYKRLQREAELCAAVQHPNIVTLYDVGYEGELVTYLATEYVNGESLLAHLRRTRPLPIEQALSVSKDLLRGLAYAHSQGIIHRDIKPGNILLTTEGQAKIADFGVARPLQSNLTVARALVGTPNYMSPEQVKSAPVSTRSDLFSAGVVMYEMLTGLKPFAAPELSGVLYNVVNGVPRPANEVNPAVPDHIARVIDRLLAKEPEDRYGTADEALAALESSPSISDAAAAPETPPAVTVPSTGERGQQTSGTADASQKALHRPVPAAVFWAVTLILSAALASTVVMLRESIAREQPAAAITNEQLREMAAKRRALATARELTREGRYEEAVRSYEDYLARYPESVVARDERELARRLLEDDDIPVDITALGTRAQPTRPVEQPEPDYPSTWQRIKRWFRGK